MVDTALSNITFNTDSDVLQELKSFPSDPLSVYRVAALNLPASENNDMLDVLLMGQATLETSTSVTETIEPVEATAKSSANLRASPSTNGALAGTVNSGDTLELVGKNAAGDWYQVLRPSQERVWIFSNLVMVTDTAALANLPVSDEGEGITSLPSLSLTYRAGTEEAACVHAAAGLVVQSPPDTPVDFNIGEIAVSLNGTAIILQAPDIVIEGGSGNDTVMVTTLLDGQLTAQLDNRPVMLTQAGDTLGISSQNNLIEITAESVAAIQANFRQVCVNTLQTGLFEIQSGAGCETIILRDISTTLPQFADALRDVLELGSNQAATADDALGADIIGVNIRMAESTSPIPDGYLVDVMMDVPPADTLNTAYSFAIAVFELDGNGNRTKGKLYQIHQGVPTMGQINLNFAPVAGTENLVSAGTVSATFNIEAETKAIDIESYLMLTPNSPRVGDTFHSDIDEAFLTG
jgi:hypothetical protein